MALGDADATLRKVIIQLKLVRQPAFQTFSTVIPVSRFIFVQPGVRSFGLGKGWLSLKVQMELRGSRTLAAWDKET